MSWDEPKTLEEAAQLARALAGASLLPDVMRSPENLLLIMGYAKSMGISPFAALRLVNVIGGRPTLSADGQQAVVRASGACARLDVVETTDERCEVIVQRNGGQPVTIVWDIARARNAEITGNKQWSKYPRQMLRARALAEACRLGFPDVVGGVYDPDELSDTDRTRKAVEQEPPAKALPVAAPAQKALPSEPESVACRECGKPVDAERVKWATPVCKACTSSKANTMAVAAPLKAIADDKTKLTSAQAADACREREADLVKLVGVAKDEVHALLVAEIKALQPKGVPSAEVIDRAAGEVAVKWTAESIAVSFDGNVTAAEAELRKRCGEKLSILAARQAVSELFNEDGDGDAEA